MAQAKTRAKPKQRSKAKAAKKQSRAKTQSRAKNSSSSSGSKSSNGQERVKAMGQAVESTAKDAGQAVGKAASKAKTPLLASGAALAGAAGGLALGAMRSRRSRKVLGVKMPQGKRVKVRSRHVAKAAKEVGSFSQHVGDLATELRHVREDSSGNGGDKGKHRSPVEVLLDGLTARR